MTDTPGGLQPEAAGPQPPAPEPGAVESVPATPQPAGPLGDLVAAHFQRVEVAMLGRILTATLAGALPAAMVRVERRRSLAQRLARQLGTPIGVSVTAADVTLTFRAPDVGVTEATVSHIVRGVVLSTQAVPVSEWLTQLAELLEKATENDQATRAALHRALLT